MASPRQQRRKKRSDTVAPPPQWEPPTGAGLSSPRLLRILLGVHMLSLLAVVLALTPLTNNLDDIKIPIFFVTGPILLGLSVWVMGRGKVSLPPRMISLPLAAYAAIVALSTVASAYSWPGYFQIVLVGSAIGYFLSAYCIASQRRTSEIFVQYFVVLLLLTNLIGLFFFDLTGSSDHHSGVAYLFDWIYGKQEPTSPNSMYFLLNTLKLADRSMLSTILNRDFYAAFCSLYLPFGLFMALTPPGRDDEQYSLRALGLITSLLAIVCVFYCQSKGEWIFSTVSCGFLAVMYFLFIPIEGLRKRHLATWLGGVALFLLLLGWMKSPTLFSQLKSLGYSVQSRSIIWSGAVNIFQEHPILGSGPGTFRLYFPEFRTPDYFLHEISNLTLFSHNYFLDLLAETGLLGFGAFCLMLGALFFGGLHQVFTLRDRRLKALLIATLAALIAIFGSNLSSPNGRWIIGASSLWTVMGWMAGLISQGRASEHKMEIEAERTANAPRFPESRGRLNPQSPFLFLGIPMVLCLVFGVYATYTGVQDFRSARRHRDGLGYMNRTYKMIDRGGFPMATIAALLAQSGEFFEEAYTINPTILSSYYKQGSVYTTLFQVQRSLAAQSQRQGDTAKMLEHLQASDDALANARAAYEALTELAPDYAEIHYNLGIVYQETAKTMALERKRLMANPLNGPQTALMDEDIKALEEKALWHLERMGKLSNKADIAELRGDQYAQAGYHEKARDVFRDGSRRYADNESLARQYFEMARRVDDGPGMMEALRTLWALHPGDNQLLDAMISLGEEKGLYEDLEAVATRLEAINPINPRLFEIRMILAEDRQQPEKLVGAAADYLGTGGKKLAWIWQAGLEAEKKGDRANATRFYQELVRLDADRQTTYGQQARLKLPLANVDGRF